MQKTLHILVVGFFALIGAELVLGGLGFALKQMVPGVIGQFFKSEVDIVFGIAYLVAAAGIYRFKLRVLLFASALLFWTTFVFTLAAFTTPGVVSLSWLALSILALVWLRWSPVRARFLAERENPKTA